jgi:hypothetical protein
MPTIDFPRSFEGLPNREDGYVYVLFYVLSGTEIPFYVGESGRFAERMSDYDWASFKCPTDFKVGMAVRYLRDQHGLRVVVRYEQSDKRKEAETALIRNYVIGGYRLLNSLPGYDYSISEPETQQRYIHSFCDMLLNTGTQAAGA